MLSYFDYTPSKEWINNSKEIIQIIQAKKLKTYLTGLWNSSTFYKDLWKRAGIYEPPTSQQSFQKLPMVYPFHLIGRTAYNILSTDSSKIRYKFCSGGTTGNPKLLYYTDVDWEKRAIYRSKLEQLRGVGKNDRVQIMVPYGIWNVGYSAQSAFELTGATVIPTGSWMIGMDTCLALMKQLKTTILMATPSLALKMANRLKCSRVDLSDLNLRFLITTGEAVPSGMRRELEEKWNTTLSATYASSEVVVGVECNQHDGYHFLADDLVIEAVDEDGNLCGEGETGEIVVTPLINEALPLIRYRLGDLVKISWEKCPCGLEYPRVWFKGRIKNTFALATGVKVYPWQIQDFMEKLSFRVQRFQIIIEDTKEDDDFLDVVLETPDTSENARKEAENAFGRLSIDLEDGMIQKNIQFKITLVDPGTFPGTQISQKQAVFIIDKRRYQR